MQPIKTLTNDTIKILKKVFVAFHLIFIATQNPIFSQCLSAPSCPPCSGGNGVATNGLNINTGNTYWYAASGTFSNINMSGGNLVVCGTLTITTLNFNQGTIYVAPGAILTIVNNVNSGGSLVNYGTVLFNSTIVWQGNPSMIYNASLTSILTANVMYINNNSQFINNGTATLSNFVIQTSISPSICQGNNAQLNLNQFTNNTNNSINSPSGVSCLSVSGSVVLNAAVTTNSALNACVLSSATVINPANWGSATISNPCISCSSALPIELINFDVQLQQSNCAKCYWQTATEINNDFFTIQRSVDAINFNDIGIVDGAGNSLQIKNYDFLDTNPISDEIAYYRLKQTDFNSHFSYSPIVAVNVKNIEITTIYPNPSSNPTVIIASPYNKEINLTIIQADGKIIQDIQYKLLQGINTININANLMSSGSYIFSVNDKNTRYTQKQFLIK